jgi:hypothetical protein
MRSKYQPFRDIINVIAIRVKCLSTRAISRSGLSPRGIFPKFPRTQLSRLSDSPNVAGESLSENRKN